jgi:hypothetical protein
MSAPARRHDAGDIPTGCPSGATPPGLVRHRWITSSLGTRSPVETQPVRTHAQHRILVRTRLDHSNRPGDLLQLIGGGTPSSHVVPRFKSAHITRTR